MRGTKDTCATHSCHQSTPSQYWARGSAMPLGVRYGSRHEHVSLENPGPVFLSPHYFGLEPRHLGLEGTRAVTES